MSTKFQLNLRICQLLLYIFVSVITPDMNFKQMLSEFTRSPTLFVFLGLLPLSPEAFMEVIAIFGILLSMAGIVFSQMRSVGMFAILWVLYLSCYKVSMASEYVALNGYIYSSSLHSHRLVKFSCGFNGKLI